MRSNASSTEATARETHKLWRCGRSGLTFQRGREVASYERIQHFHDEYQFMLVQDGIREISFGRDRRLFGSDVMTIVNPGDAHSTRCSGTFGSSFRTMHIPSTVVDDARRQLGTRMSNPVLFPFSMSDPEVLRRFTLAHEAHELGIEPLEQEELLLGFLQALLKQGRPRRSVSSDHPSMARTIHRACEYLQVHYKSAGTLDDLSSSVGASKYHLVRSFRDATRMTPHAYLIGVRLKHAQRLLADGVAAKRVAAETGFADVSHLGRHFRKVVGFTPAAYQRMLAS